MEQKYNTGLASLANKSGFQVIENNYLDQPNYQYDSLHLNNKGPAKMVRNFKEKLWPAGVRFNTEGNRHNIGRPQVNTHAAAPTVNQERGPIHNGYTNRNPPQPNSVAYNSFQPVPAQPPMQSQPPTSHFI